MVKSPNQYYRIPLDYHPLNRITTDNGPPADDPGLNTENEGPESIDTGPVIDDSVNEGTRRESPVESKSPNVVSRERLYRLGLVTRQEPKEKSPYFGQ